MKENIIKYFDYKPFGQFKDRMKDLQERTFNRFQLTNVLEEMNNEWNAPDETIHNIERLKNKDSVVVIGGQQAGLLTGPLYTINKVISIVKLAKQQESELGIPVIPVFWIAGEDHDFDEINHIFLRAKSRMKKYKIGQQVTVKNSVSNIELNDEEAVHWLNLLFKELEETNITRELYTSIKDSLAKSRTYTDFFAHLLFKLFPQEGLVLIDSAHREVRKLESSHFAEIIDKQHEISMGVSNQLDGLAKEGYDISLEASGDDAHLFYQNGDERILLIRNSDGSWVGKNNEVVFSTKELLQIAEESPERLSNNVVTRPLMQELLFPTLAFIAGPGEISYWAALKPVFKNVDIKMPPVVPRLSFTYIDRKVSKSLNQFDLTAEFIVNNGVDLFREEWFDSKTEPSIHELIIELKQTIKEAHKPVEGLAKTIRSDIGELANKNLFYLHKHVDFLEKRMIKAVQEKHEKELSDLENIGICLHPEGLQERVWNPLPFINKYGFHTIRELMKEPCSFEKDHYLVFL